MKIIEERANLAAIEDTSKGRYRKDYFISAMADHENGFKEGYIQGAIEQKVIDDRECETMVGYAVKECKQVMIDKACEWLNKQLYTDDGGCLASEWYQQLGNFLAAFREAMEEEL